MRTTKRNPHAAIAAAADVAAALRSRSAIERLEDRCLYSAAAITPQILMLNGSGSATPLVSGQSYAWPAGVALHVRAVDTVNADATFTPHQGTNVGTTFAAGTGATPNNTRFAWDFGDSTADDTDQLVGFNAAHLYDPTAATSYTLTLAATDLNGVAATPVTVTINVTPGSVGSGTINGQTVPTYGLGPSTPDVPAGTTTGKIVYVDTAAAAGGDGSAAHPLQSWAAALSAYTSAKSATPTAPVTQIRLKRGEHFDATDATASAADSQVGNGNVPLSNLLIGAYGSSGDDPILRFVNTNASALISTHNAISGTANLTVQDIHFASSYTAGATGAAFVPDGTDITMRRCEFGGDSGDGTAGTLIDDTNDKEGAIDGLLYQDNDDGGQTIQQFAFVLTGSDDDLVVVGNKTTGYSTQPQPMDRIDCERGYGGRLLVEKNTFEPAHSAGEAALTTRQAGFYQYVADNTFNRLTAQGNGDPYNSNKTSHEYTNGYGFKWVVWDSNRMIDGVFQYDNDEYHLTFRNNVIQNFSEPTSQAINDNAPSAYVRVGSGIAGTQDLEVVDNTLYYDAGDTYSLPQSMLFAGSTGTDPNTGTTSVLVGGVAYVDNLIVNTRASYTSSAALAVASEGELDAAYTNVFPVANRGSLVSVGQTGLSISQWNATGYRRSANTANPTYNAAQYDDLSQSLTINHDTDATSVPASAAYPNYGVTSTTVPAGTFYPGAEFDFYGHLRTSQASWTPGAVNTYTPPVTTPTKLTGTYIGTTGAYNNGTNVGTNAFDGDVTTYFDGPDANGDWVGQDLGSQYNITSISFAPRKGFPYRMRSGQFQGSNTADFSSGVTTLYTVASNVSPTEGQLTTVSVSGGPFRYVRYLGPDGGECDVAEVQFFGTPAVTPSAVVAAPLAATVNGGGTAAPADLDVTTKPSPSTRIGSTATPPTNRGGWAQLSDRVIGAAGTLLADAAVRSRVDGAIGAPLFSDVSIPAA